MGETTTGCQSCSMPIEAGPLCQNCSDASGELIPFSECLERFVQWTTTRQPGISREDAEKKTLEFMASMPAWRDHQDLRLRMDGEG